VRLCGVTANGLQPAEAPRQLTLDEPRCQQGERLAHVLDEIAGKFGDGAIVRGARLQPTARALRAEEGSEED